MADDYSIKVLPYPELQSEFGLIDADRNPGFQFCSESGLAGDLQDAVEIRGTRYCLEDPIVKTYFHDKLKMRPLKAGHFYSYEAISQLFEPLVLFNTNAKDFWSTDKSRAYESFQRSKNEVRKSHLYYSYVSFDEIERYIKRAHDLFASETDPKRRYDYAVFLGTHQVLDREIYIYIVDYWMMHEDEFCQLAYDAFEPIFGRWNENFSHDREKGDETLFAIALLRSDQKQFLINKVKSMPACSVQKLSYYDSAHEPVYRLSEAIDLQGDIGRVLVYRQADKTSVEDLKTLFFAGIHDERNKYDADVSVAVLDELLRRRDMGENTDQPLVLADAILKDPLSGSNQKYYDSFLAGLDPDYVLFFDEKRAPESVAQLDFVNRRFDFTMQQMEYILHHGSLEQRSILANALNTSYENKFGYDGSVTSIEKDAKKAGLDPQFYYYMRHRMLFPLRMILSQEDLPENVRKKTLYNVRSICWILSQVPDLLDPETIQACDEIRRETDDAPSSWWPGWLSWPEWLPSPW